MVNILTTNQILEESLTCKRTYTSVQTHTPQIYKFMKVKAGENTHPVPHHPQDPCLYAVEKSLCLSSGFIKCWSSHRASAVTNPGSNHEDEGSIPGLTQWVKDPVLP